jgi:hypothetical protein
MNERLKELAEKAGIEWELNTNWNRPDGWWKFESDDLERFAELVRADEREACAMECIKLASSWARLGAWGAKTDFHECAAAIRARCER